MDISSLLNNHSLPSPPRMALPPLNTDYHIKQQPHTPHSRHVSYPDRQPSSFSSTLGTAEMHHITYRHRSRSHSFSVPPLPQLPPVSELLRGVDSRLSHCRRKSLPAVSFVGPTCSAPHPHYSYPRLRDGSLARSATPLASAYAPERYAHPIHHQPRVQHHQPTFHHRPPHPASHHQYPNSTLGQWPSLDSKPLVPVLYRPLTHAPSPSATSSSATSSSPTTVESSHRPDRRRRKSLPSPQELNKRHVCQVAGCGKNFSTSGHLSRHRRLHSGAKPYSCPIPACPSEFSRHDNMQQHYRGHIKKLNALGATVITSPSGAVTVSFAKEAHTNISMEGATTRMVVSTN